MTDFMLKIVTKDSEGHFLMIEGICASWGNHTPKYLCTYANHVKQLLVDLKEDTNRNLIVVRDFNTPLSSLNRSIRLMLIKEILDMKEWMEDKGYYKALHSLKAKYTFFSTKGKFSRIDIKKKTPWSQENN